MTKKGEVLLQVVVTPEQKQRMKMAAVRRRMTLREAVVAAFAAWEGTEAAPPAKSGRAQSKQRFVEDAQRLAAELAGQQVENAAAVAVQEWLKRALALDWSKCPEVERGPNRVWQLKGTAVPLWNVLQALSGGNPVEEIAEVYEIPVARVAGVARHAK